MITNDNYLGAKTSQNEPSKYHCKRCDYFTSKLANWKRHLKTKKHNGNHMVTNDNFLGAKTSQNEPTHKWICSCGKTYKYKSGLSRHKTKCTYIKVEKADDSLISQENNVNMQDILVVMKDLVDKNNKLTEKVIELSSKQSPLINGNNNKIQNNFNIHMFLDRDCKNAISIQDFAKKLVITMNDISLLKNNEPKAITNIITENLKDYTETERPFHHHKKRWYIKDKQEGWDKEGVKKGEKIVKNVKDCVSKKVPKIFVDNNPNFLNNEKQGADYAETIVVAMKEVKDKDSKVVLKNLKNGCTI